jgi:His-Xaa-Ser system radical SAM maturase HxsB
LVDDSSSLELDRRAELESKFFLGNPRSMATMRLLASRIAAKKSTLLSGPSLHIIVPTLQCAHTCRYCQVSRASEGTGFSMTTENLDKASLSCFESKSKTLTIEFQGGDPLLRFDLVRRAIENISRRNASEKRSIRFVVASTLHQLDESMCRFFKEYQVVMSTSLDGPCALHNKNRPIPGGRSYEKTLAGIELARREIGSDSVSALMTTTRESLGQPEAIVDEYVRLDFKEIFLRPLSNYGFAKKNQNLLGYSEGKFSDFYRRGLERVLHWNKQGVPIREATAAIVLNKLLCTFDGGYVDLQSPSGAALSTLVYNYDGFVYPSDEARMIAENPDVSLRLGPIGASLNTLLASSVSKALVANSLVQFTPGCDECAFNTYCGPDPVNAYSGFGQMDIPIQWTEHCKRSKWLFDYFLNLIDAADEGLLDLFYRWAHRRA